MQGQNACLWICTFRMHVPDACSLNVKYHLAGISHLGGWELDLGFGSSTFWLEITTCKKHAKKKQHFLIGATKVRKKHRKKACFLHFSSQNVGKIIQTRKQHVFFRCFSHFSSQKGGHLRNGAGLLDWHAFWTCKKHPFLNSRLEPQNKENHRTKMNAFCMFPFKMQVKSYKHAKNIHFFDVFHTFPARKVEISEMELDWHAFWKGTCKNTCIFEF